MNFERTAKDLLNIIKPNNIENVTHCSTRLRIKVKNLEQIDSGLLEKTEGVVGTVIQGNTLQIIIGLEVGRVYSAFVNLYQPQKSDDNKNSEIVAGKKENLLSKTLSFLAAAFLPTMPIVVAAGMISAILNILILTIGLSTDSSTYNLINAIASTGFFFLPLYVGYGSARQLNLNPVYGIFLGAVLLNEGINGVDNLSFFGLPVLTTTYSYTGLPVMLGVMVMAQVHKFLAKRIPAYFKEVLVPILVITSGTLITLLIVGPLGVILGDGIAAVIVFIHKQVGGLASALVGAFFGFTVLTGTNKALVPFMVTSLTAQGYDNFLIPAMMGTNIAIGTATLAVAYLEKDPFRRGTQISAGITGLMGISEPSLFGILINDKKALYGSMIGGAAGGLLAGTAGLAQNSIVSGIPGLPTMIISIPPYEGLTNMYWGVAVILLSGVVGFVATIILKKGKK
ncbi:PTS transporter subunit EIIC [Lacrimispora sp.]|uniref:PTS transporter subunit EIIC n=1 Tax=Lacrimispora sp. TaxID=2719234 RepID=UPI002897158F|nr:PTS transporter subunit EIIC [Lacrimispora sp.]